MIKPNTIRNLTSYGIPEFIIERWIASLNSQFVSPQDNFDLTEFQSVVLGSEEIYQSNKNLLIIGPTSAGKTFVAETIIANHLVQNPDAKILFLQPLRALVTEKYERFVNIFEDPYQIIAASSDYPQCDTLVASGHWNITIAVFDVIYHWFAHPKLLTMILSKVSLIVVDELQCLDIEERGEKLEIILSFVRWLSLNSRKHIQIVGLGATEPIAESLAQWLDAETFPKQKVSRPIKLYQGIFLYPEMELELYEEQQQDAISNVPQNVLRLTSQLSMPSNSIKRFQLTTNIVTNLVQSGYKVLVFTYTQADAVALAKKIAKALPQEPLPENVQQWLNAAEETQVIQDLRQTLDSRVGFHHGDMSRSERRIVEEGFKSAQATTSINVVVTTATLTMGVNLAADVVIVHQFYTRIPSESEEGQLEYLERRYLSFFEYINLAGRAGRFHAARRDDDFGLCLVITEKRDYDELRAMIRNSDTGLRSKLEAPIQGLHPHVLAVVSALQITGLHDEYATLREQVQDVFTQTFCYVYAATNQKKNLKQQVGIAFDELVKEGFLTQTGLTSKGSVAAGMHLCLKSAILLYNLARQFNANWVDNWLTLIHDISYLPEIEREYPRYMIYNRTTLPKQTANLQNYLQNSIPQDVLACYPFLSHFANEIQDSDPTGISYVRVARVIALWCWIQGMPALEMQKIFPRISNRTAESLGERMAIYIGAIRQFVELRLDLDFEIEPIHQQLWLFETMLRYGGPPKTAVVNFLAEFSLSVRLSRTALFEIEQYTRTQPDLRTWLDVDRPTWSNFPLTWQTVQKVLRWWRDEASLIISDKGVAYSAIESMTRGDHAEVFKHFTLRRVSQGVTTSSTQSRWTITPFDLEIILLNTQRRLTTHDLERRGYANNYIQNIVKSAPLRGHFAVNRFRGEGAYIVGIGDQRFNLQIFKSFQELINSEAEDVEIGVLLNNPPKGAEVQSSSIRLIITMEALTAGHELIVRFPEMMPYFFMLLVSTEEIFFTVDDLVKWFDYVSGKDSLN